jgi:hypothetical protein
LVNCENSAACGAFFFFRVVNLFLLGSVVVLLHVAVEYFQQLVVYRVKIGADDDAVSVVFHRDDVD